MDSSRARRYLMQLGLVTVGLAWGSLLEASEPADGTKYALVSQHRRGDLARVEVSMQVGGDLKLADEGTTRSLPMSVVANLGYDERLLSVDARGLPKRTIRYYDDVRAVIKVDKGGEKPSLDESRRMIAVERPDKGPPVMFCAHDPLKREELDLIDVHANSVLVDSLLPEEPMALGTKWKLADEALAQLLTLDAVSWTDVEAMIETVKDGMADMAAAGSVSGAVAGVSTEIQFKARYRFDLKRKRVTYVAILVKEKRAVGHVGPGLDTVAKLVMTLVPIETSQHLASVETAEVPPLSPTVSQLEFANEGGRYRFQYDRRWYVTSDDPKLAVLRLVDRGELVAQCNISALPSAKSPVTLAEFQQDVQRSLGKNFGQFVHAAESKSPAGYAVLRIVARGTVSGLPIEWIYYLVSDDKGQRVSMSFTFEQSLAERFAQADRVLASQLQITEPPAPTTARLPEK